MNAAARALAQGTLSRHHFREMAFSLQSLIAGLLMIGALLTAFSVVYVKDLNRRLFSDWHALQQNRDELNVEWGQLLLEKNTWSTAARIQHIAQNDLAMYIPPSQVVVMVKP